MIYDIKITNLLTFIIKKKRNLWVIFFTEDLWVIKLRDYTKKIENIMIRSYLYNNILDLIEIIMFFKHVS